MLEIFIDEFETEVKIPRVIDRLTTRTSRLHPVGKEMAEWLYNNIGPGIAGLQDRSLIDDHHVWYSQVWFGYVLYHFKREADATMFKLKWS